MVVLVCARVFEPSLSSIRRLTKDKSFSSSSSFSPFQHEAIPFSADRSPTMHEESVRSPHEPAASSEPLTAVALASQGKLIPEGDKEEERLRRKTGAFNRQASSKNPRMTKRGSMIRASMITAADAMQLGSDGKKGGDSSSKKRWGRVRSIFLRPDDDNPDSGMSKKDLLSRLKNSSSPEDASKITSQSKVQTMIDSLGDQEKEEGEAVVVEDGGFKKLLKRGSIALQAIPIPKFLAKKKISPTSLDSGIDDTKESKGIHRNSLIKKKADKNSVFSQFMRGVKGEKKEVETQLGAAAWKLWEGWVENQEQLNLRFFQLNPKGTFVKAWNSLIFFMATYNAFTIPYRLAFHSASYSNSINGFDVAIDIAYMLDIFFKFVTPYEDAGQTIITEQASIVGHYVSRFFFYDGLCAVPLDLILVCGATFSATAIIVVFRLIRVSKLLYLLRFMDLSAYNISQQEAPRVDPVLLRLIKLIFFLSLFLHWVSCVAIHVSDIDKDEVVPIAGGGTGYAIDLWLGVADFEEESDRLRYFLCLYFTFVTMIGEKTAPQTERQVVTTLIMLICGLVTYVSIVGNLVSLINQIDSTSSAYNQKRDQLAIYMNSRNFPPKLRHRINRYFHYLHEKNKGIDDATMIEDLPPYLRKEVALFLNRNIIVKVPMFRGLSITFITALVVRLKPLLCLDDDYIIRDGEVGNEMYFLLKGDVQVIDPEGGIIASLPAGAFFGEMALVYNEKRNASVRAAKTCELLVLTRKAFEEVMLQFPDEATVITQYARERYKETNLQQTEVSPSSPKRKTAQEMKMERMRRSSIDHMIWGTEQESADQGFESILAMQNAAKGEKSSTAVTPLKEPEEPEDPLSIGEA